MTYRQIKGYVRARLTFPNAVLIDGQPRRIGLVGRLALHAYGVLDAIVKWDAGRKP